MTRALASESRKHDASLRRPTLARLPQAAQLRNLAAAGIWFSCCLLGLVVGWKRRKSGRGRHGGNTLWLCSRGPCEGVIRLPNLNVPRLTELALASTVELRHPWKTQEVFGDDHG